MKCWLCFKEMNEFEEETAIKFDGLYAHKKCQEGWQRDRARESQGHQQTRQQAQLQQDTRNQIPKGDFVKAMKGLKHYFGF